MHPWWTIRNADTLCKYLHYIKFLSHTLPTHTSLINMSLRTKKKYTGLRASYDQERLRKATSEAYKWSHKLHFF